MAQSCSESELDEQKQCTICAEAFTDPRVLPCIHTFCLKCLLNYAKEKQPGDIMPCPLCRNEFTIPNDGLIGTGKSFFLEEMLQVKNPSAVGLKQQQRISCHVCRSDEENDDTTVKPATMHCVQCQESYCDQCSRSHARMKATAEHIQMEIDKVGSLQQTAVTLLPTPATCEIHDGKEIEVFCQECKIAICVMCVIQSHKNHDCSGVEKVSGDLRKQGKCDAGKIIEKLKATREFLCGFEKSKNNLINQLADIDDEINRTTDKLIDYVSRERVKLLSEVESVRQKRAKQLETVKQELEQHMAALASFQEYSEKLFSSGTDCDVARWAKNLHERADELMKVDVIGHVQSCLPRVPNIKFTSSTIANGEADNLVGYITGDDKCVTVTLTHVLWKGNSVGGVASLCNDIFVVRYNVKHVQVYDAKTFTLKCCIPVPGLALRSFGMAVCAANKCLYVSEFDADKIHRVELSGSNAVTNWCVARSPVGLSVNNAQNVLVVSQDERKLQEFTTRGSLVREVRLQRDLEGPRHAIQLSADKFLVSHHNSQHRVCLVDAKGAVVRSYGGPRGRGCSLPEMTNPGCLAVDKHGNVLVADRANDRLLVLDQSLSSAHEMSVSVDGGLQGPFSLFYDECRRRLHIGEWEGGRVIVIDNLKDFCKSPT